MEKKFKMLLPKIRLSKNLISIKTSINIYTTEDKNIIQKN